MGFGIAVMTPLETPFSHGFVDGSYMAVLCNTNEQTIKLFSLKNAAIFI